MQGTSDGSTADDGTGRGASGSPGSPGAPATPDSPDTPASPAAHGSPDGPGGASGQGRRFRLRGPRTPEGGRRMAAVAWVCAVAAAFLLGAWSFAQVDQGDRYQRLDPLDEASVHHELAQSRKRTGAGPGASLPPGSTDPSGGSHSTATAPSDDDHDGDDDDDDDDDEHDDHDEHGDHDEDDEDGGGAGSGDASAGGPAHVSTVRFPEGLGTAVAECRSGTRTVTLLSWSPAQGYSADDVEPGPTRTATVELERASDDSDDGDDRTVAVECVHGKPHTSLHKDSDDDGDDEDD